MTGLIMLEGLPGSGKSTTAHGLGEWLARRGVAVEHWAEGRTDHPVDFEQVAVLTNDDVVRILGEMPAAADALIRAAERSGDVWLVRHAQHPGLPMELVERLRRHDGYDGTITPELHSQVLTESWRRFGRRDAAEPVQLWECVLIQNPVCALLARFDQPEWVLERHVRGLVDAVADHAPALVYLDPGDPARVLERAAAERPPEWLDAVIEYHTGQGYGLARGLHGFDGYVEFMRHRREVELALLPRLPLPTLVLRTGDGDWPEHTRAVRRFAAEHVGLDPAQVA